MRIAFLHQPNDPYTQVRIKYFASQGHKVYSIVFHSGNKQKPISDVTIISLPYKLSARIPFFKRIVYAMNIREITSKNDIDVLYIVSALNSYYLKSSKAKCNFLEIQGSDVIIAPKKFPFLKPFYKSFWKYADGIIQDSDLAKQKAKAYLPSGTLNKTIEIGVDLSVFNPNVEKGRVRKKYGLGDRPIIFHSRSIKKLYNVDKIIKSIPIVLEHVPTACFLFTGNFEQLARITKKFVNKNGLQENIFFCGQLDHETEIKYYYRDADLLVSIPSSDSSPFSVYEAMATKIPIIVSDLPWFKGKFIPNKHIKAVSDNNVLALSKVIIQLVNKEVVLDLDGAYNVVFEKINMFVENKKLEKLFELNRNK